MEGKHFDPKGKMIVVPPPAKDPSVADEPADTWGD